MIKKKLNILSFLLTLFVAVGFVACDKIPEDDMREKGDIVLPDWQGQYILLDEFTGVRCPNCPLAAIQAKFLKKIFGDKLIILELHPSKNSLTQPVPATLAGTRSDLRSIDADVYNIYWGETVGLPKGLINREQAVGAFLNYPTWMATALEIYARKAVAELELTANFTDNTKTAIDIDISGKFIEDYIKDGELNIITMIIEDSIVVAQAMPAGTPPDMAYNHSHVLRKTLDNAWGIKILEPKPVAGTNFVKNYVGIALDANWFPNKLSIVAFISNASTREVIQVATVPVK